jgi:hypothetical protein
VDNKHSTFSLQPCSEASISLSILIHFPQTYIGTLLVSVNPYKELGIYTKKQMDIYMGVNFFELPPHM